MKNTRKRRSSKKNKTRKNPQGGWPFGDKLAMILKPKDKDERIKVAEDVNKIIGKIPKNVYGDLSRIQKNVMDERNTYEKAIKENEENQKNGKENEENQKNEKENEENEKQYIKDLVKLINNKAVTSNTIVNIDDNDIKNILENIKKVIKNIKNYDNTQYKLDVLFNTFLNDLNDIKELDSTENIEKYSNYINVINVIKKTIFPKTQNNTSNTNDIIKKEKYDVIFKTYFKDIEFTKNEKPFLNEQIKGFYNRKTNPIIWVIDNLDKVCSSSLEECIKNMDILLLYTLTMAEALENKQKNGDFININNQDKFKKILEGVKLSISRTNPGILKKINISDIANIVSSFVMSSL